LWRLVLATVAPLVFAFAVSAQTATIRLAGDIPFEDGPPSIQGKLPVLFVHGHGDPSNYKKNWQEPLVERNLPSFKDMLGANPDLAIEPYYISFDNADTRSITDDAIEIGNAIERILHRHDPERSAEDTSVKVVIIAYSQGTISSRQYLKSLQTQVDGMPAPRPTFRPVSEFIAIAPPNHGLGTRLFALTSSLAVKQLYNGQRPRTERFDRCGQDFAQPADIHYIEILNKANSLDPHVIGDTQDLSAGRIFPGEAPGSRSATDAHSVGTLYVTLFDEDDRDIVGGDIDSTDCVGRAVASNRAPNAENVPVSGISEDGWETVLDANPAFDIGNLASAIFTPTEKQSASVHQNTVHTFDVMCKALYSAVHHTSPVGVTCASTNVTVDGLANQVPVPVIPLPKRAAAMLTLDFSGSMALTTGPGATRASVLKDSIELFVNLWKAVSVPTDRLGATYFRTGVTRFPTTGDPMPLLSSGGQSIVDDINNNQSPSDLTAMGGGLQVAIEALRDFAADSAIRRVILFTDGMQNVNPMVRNVGGELRIDDEPGRPSSGVMVPATPFVLNHQLGVTAQQLRPISIDTIGIGAGDTFVTRLAEIALATNGHTRATVDIDLLRQFFVDELINALKGFSPQLVDYRRGAVARNGSTEAFVIEDGVRKLVLKTSWKRGQWLDFTVAKDGVDVTSRGRFIKGDFYKIFVIDLPAKGIATRGNWQVKINGKSGTAYEAAAIVDGSAITYDSAVSVKQPRAGDPLELVMRVTARGQPVSSKSRATVTWHTPTATAGDIIAKYVPKELPALEPGMSLGERQLLALTQDPKSLALLKGKSNKLVVKPTSKGDFRVRLSTGVPGIYTVFITVKRNDAKLGAFSRTMAITVAVRSSGADQRMTTIVAQRAIGRQVNIVVTPRDADGHFIGPGLASDFSLQVTEGDKIGVARDLGNGSYELSFEAPADKDPSATVTIAGKSLFSGKLSQLSRKKSK